MSTQSKILAGALFCASCSFATPPALAHSKDQNITIIHTGDFHGHLIPRANVRSDTTGRSEGGLARIATVINKIRSKEKNVLYVHTGDTIQGGAEVLFTRGQAIVDILNMPEFGIDAFAPGNWEFVYGTQRFIELFGNNAPLAPWGTVAANLFYTTGDSNCKNRSGERPVAPYKIKMIGKIKVGILGLTTDRGPQVVGAAVTDGLCFLRNGDDVFVTNATTGITTQTAGGVDSEVAEQIHQLRNVEGVDLVVMASEMGLANNIRLAQKIDGIDVVLSSDMHEETANAVVIVNPVSGRKTIVVEEGQDGTMMGKLELELSRGKVKEWKWNPIRVDSSIAENKKVAARIKEIRKGFTGTNYADKINPFNGSYLKRPIDAIVGTTAIPLHRSNFTDEDMPAIIEGSSHDFLTDAFKAMSGANIAAIRGFRYGTHVPVGPIKYEDLFHYLPIGPQIAMATLKGQAIKNQIENAANGSLNPNIIDWSGGWLFNFSGVTMDFDPYVALTSTAPFPLTVGRAFNIKVNNADLVLGNDYSYASYWYSTTPCSVNTIAISGCVVDAVTGAPSNITILKDADGSPLDATEVVVKYLQSLTEPVNPVLNRITLKDKTTGLPTTLPAAKFGNQELQPLLGAQR